jgi:phage tail sheath protein FI
MPEYLAPGVFMEEIERGPKPIEGVATSTTALLGETERGPTKPTFITSYGDYLRQFGDTFGEGKYVPYGVKGFFDNGGRRAYIARIVGDNATPPRSTSAIST